MSYFMTNAGYLSVTKKFLDTTSQSYITIGEKRYSIRILKTCITYRDNRDYYRWQCRDYNRAEI